MARGKWFLPYRANRINYEDVGADPYFVQHDIGFSGDKLFRAVKWNGPNSGTFTLVGEVRSAGDTAGYGQRAKAVDTRKAHAKAVADARRLAGKQNPRDLGGMSVKNMPGFGWYILSRNGQHVQVRIKGRGVMSYFSSRAQAEKVAAQIKSSPELTSLRNPSWRRTVKGIKKARRKTAAEGGYKYKDFPSRMKQSWVARGRTKRRVNRRTRRRRY